MSIPTYFSATGSRCGARAGCDGEDRTPLYAPTEMLEEEETADC
jgi:hypothetical protein